MHNNILCFSTPAFVPTVFALVRKLFCLSPGLSEVILCAAMSGLLRKAVSVFLCSYMCRMEKKKNAQGISVWICMCGVFQNLFLFCTLPQLECTDVIYDIVPKRLFLMWSECGDEKQQDVSHEPNAWQPARCARDAMSHGTQHLFPLGPIIATPRLRIHQPSSGVTGVACWWLHFPFATVWVMAKANVQFIGEWNAIT